MIRLNKISRFISFLLVPGKGKLFVMDLLVQGKLGFILISLNSLSYKINGNLRHY